MFAFARPVRSLLACLTTLLLASCGGHRHQAPVVDSTQLIDIHLLAFNDLHGHLEPPGTHTAIPTGNGQSQKIATGGMVWMAGTVQQLRQQYPHHAVVSAGDMVGSSPLLSSYFLDEPTIEAANALRMDFAAVGNHEFDRGWQELLRLAHGGCAQHTQRQPCRVNPQFEGAQFPLLAANVRTAQGHTLLPATGLKTFTQGAHQVTVGFIGMTLKATPKLVMQSAVEGLQFTDEAATANALVPQLLAQGADVIAVLLHEGGHTRAPAFAVGCAGLSGAIVPILDQLDPRISVVVSGHTHQSYVCDYATVRPDRPMLLTSAGLYGTQLTDIQLRWNPVQRTLHSRSARTLAIPANAQAAATASPVIVPQVHAHTEVQSVIERYRRVIADTANEIVGSVLSPGNAPLASQPAASGEVQLGNLIADAQVWAMQHPSLGGADISFMHSGGIRAPLQPAADGSVTYGQLYAIQPFGNTFIGMTLNGAEIVALLENSYTVPRSSSGRTRVLSPNAALSWQHDRLAPTGEQVKDVRLHGQPLKPDAEYRVIVSSFLADGGDRYAIFAQGRNPVQGPTDIDALEAYLKAHSPLTAPATNRIR